MRIIVAAENLPTRSRTISGGRYHSLFIASALCELGHHVVLATDNRPSFWGEFSRFYPMPEVMLTNDPVRIAGRFSRIDLVISYPIVWSAPTLSLARKLKAPCWAVVLDCETICKEYAPAVASRMHYGSRHTKALRDSDLLLSISDFAVPFVKEWTGNENVISLMGCVNSRLADTVPGGRGDRFIAITRLTEHKRINDLIFVAKQTGAHIDIITSHHPGEVARRVNSVSDRIWVHASLGEQEKFEMLKSARALVCPSAYEGLGIPAMEAMYCATPVVCYDFPILKEVCGDGALYASYCSPESLARQVQKMRDGDVRQNKAAKAFWQGRNYSFGMLCKRLKEVIERWMT